MLIDEIDVGDEYLVVEPGERLLQVRKRGFTTHEEIVDVASDDQQILIDVELLQLSQWQAMGSSAVLAGLGQLYQSRPVTGWSMMALQIGAWSWLFWAEDQYKSTRDDYLTALTAYETATLRDEEATAGIPIVVLTAKELTPEDRERLHGKIQGVLSKTPMDRRLIVHSIREVESRWSAHE